MSSTKRSWFRFILLSLIMIMVIETSEFCCSNRRKLRRRLPQIHLFLFLAVGTNPPYNQYCHRHRHHCHHHRHHKYRVCQKMLGYGEICHFKHILIFSILAVPSSREGQSLDGLITDWLTHLLKNTSRERSESLVTFDSKALRHLIRVMRKHDLTNNNKYIWRKLSKTCELWDIWWKEDMAWPTTTKRQKQRLRQLHRCNTNSEKSLNKR